MGIYFTVLIYVVLSKSNPVTTDREKAQIDMYNDNLIPDLTLAHCEDHMCDHESCMIPDVLHIAASF